jgi:hypothetical protein
VNRTARKSESKQADSVEATEGKQSKKQAKVEIKHKMNLEN